MVVRQELPFVRDPNRMSVHSGKLVVSKLGDSGRVIRMAGLEPGDFFGEMTLIEMQSRSANVVAEKPNRAHGPKPLHVLQGRHPCVMVMQNINRELCRRLRRAENRIAELQMLQASQWHRCACVTWLRKGKPQAKCWRNDLVLRCEKPESPMSQLGQSGHFGRRPAF
jgi:Cyclic nucleotide-binding domain